MLQASERSFLLRGELFGHRKRYSIGGECWIQQVLYMQWNSRTFCRLGLHEKNSLEVLMLSAYAIKNCLRYQAYVIVEGSSKQCVLRLWKSLD